jgi:hypothetical protein
MQEQIVRLAQIGCYEITISKAVGLDKHTIRQWRLRGRKERKGKFWDFDKAITKAEGEAEEMLLKGVWSIAQKDGNWTALMTIMERRYPERWGRKNILKVEVQQGIQSILDVLLPRLTPEARGEVVRHIADIQGVDREALGDVARSTVH